jgi:hypothetical protein
MTSIKTTAGQATCRRCHATLRSAASVAAGIGPRCAAIRAATQGMTADQSAKAAEAVSEGAVQRTGRKDIFRVVSSDGETVHTCSVHGHCTCAWGRRRVSASTKTCWHVAAARITARPRIRRAA